MKDSSIKSPSPIAPPAPVESLSPSSGTDEAPARSPVRYLWILAVILAIAFIVVDGKARLATIHMISNSGVGGTTAPTLDPKSLTGYYGNQHILIEPAIGTDGYHWTMQTERMLSGNEGLRVRHTDYDNPPNGRDVHWSSLLHWVGASLAWVGTKVTAINFSADGWAAATAADMFGPYQPGGLPIQIALSYVAPWANTFCLIVFILAVVPAVARRFGSVPATLLAIGFIAVYPYYEFSIVGYYDHHGLAASYDLAMVLFLVGGGAGWLRNDVARPDRLTPIEKPLWDWLPDRAQARRWFIISAAFGGAALWISAASVVPAMMGVGFGALLGTGCLARGLDPKSPWRADATLWRLWGRAGCVSSLFFYALEYMPSNFTWRLEVNHPLFALTWLAAGDFLCRLCEYIQSRPVAGAKAPAKSAPAPVVTLAASPAKTSLLPVWGWVTLDLLAIASIPLAVLCFPASNGYAGSAFVIPDHFLWSLHTDYIIEFRSLARQLSQLSWQEILGGISLLPILIFLVVALLWRADAFKASKLYWRLLLVCMAALGLYFVHGVYYSVIWNIGQAHWLGMDPQQATVQAVSQAQATANLLSLIPDILTVLLLLVLPLTIETPPELPPDLARPWKALLLLAVFPAIVLLLLAFKQIRWLGIGCSLWLGALAATALVVTRAGPGFRWTTARQILAGAFLALVLLPYPGFTMYQWEHFELKYPVTMLDLTQLITRDVSQRLRTRLGDKPGVIVSGPTTTTWMMYFGGFKGLGTLYWENIDGLKAVAAIYSAATPEEALELVKKYGVTDIAIFSWDPFADEYAKLHRGLRLADDTPTNSFIYQVLHSGKVPVWLRPLPYRLPQEGELKNQYVMILEVDLDQTPEEAAVRVGQYLWSQGLTDQAAVEFRDALTHTPNYLPALVALARLQQGLGQIDSFNATLQTIRENLAQASTIPFQDRVDLAVVFALANDREQAQKLITDCLTIATDKDLRTLQPDALFNLFQLTRQMNLTGLNPKVMTMAFNLLPPESQTEALAEQAGVEARAKHFDRAVALYTQALAIEPNSFPILNNLAVILSTAPDASIRNGTQALVLAKKAADIDKFQHLESYDALASAEAETGDFNDAVIHIHQALELAQAANATGNQTALIDQLNKRLAAYQKNTPYHQAP